MTGNWQWTQFLRNLTGADSSVVKLTAFADKTKELNSIRSIIVLGSTRTGIMFIATMVFDFAD